jgi:hypothetical protein
MSDTPETDAAWDKYISPPYTYWAGDLRILAQRLERERDEARHKLELCMAANSDVARIAKERDEAREQNAKLREIADALGGALERLDALYRSEQDSEAPMPRPDWLRRPLQMLDAELDQLKEGAK